MPITVIPKCRFKTNGIKRLQPQYHLKINDIFKIL